MNTDMHSWTTCASERLDLYNSDHSCVNQCRSINMLITILSPFNLPATIITRMQGICASLTSTLMVITHLDGLISLGCDSMRLNFLRAYIMFRQTSSFSNGHLELVWEKESLPARKEWTVREYIAMNSFVCLLTSTYILSLQPNEDLKDINFDNHHRIYPFDKFTPQCLHLRRAADQHYIRLSEVWMTTEEIP